MVGEEHLPLLVHPPGLGHKELHILIVTEEIADRIGNLLGAQHGGRQLVKEGLKQMVVMTVHQEHIHILLGKIPGQLDTTKAAAYYHYLLPVCHHKTLPNTIPTHFKSNPKGPSEKNHFNL